MKVITTSIFLLGLVSQAWAQGNPGEDPANFKTPQVVPPSPNSASLGKYVEQPVSKYTGVPAISIALHEVRVRDLSIPLSLSYHAGGIRVDEEASWVGLGWSLNAGGVISRTVRGNDDLLNDTRKGYPYSTSFDLTDLDDDGIVDERDLPLTTLQYLCNQVQDGEPDVFFYNFMGHSGKFVMNMKNNISEPITVSVLSNDKIRIVYDEGASIWTVWTIDGFKYEFAAKEKAETWTAETRLAPFVRDPYESAITTSWYLTRVTSALGEVANFVYDLQPDGSSLYGSESVPAVAEKNATTLAYMGDPSAFQHCKGYTHFTRSKTGTTLVYLKEIHFKHGIVKFQKGIRDDMRPYNNLNTGQVYQSPQRLTQIQVQRTDGSTVKSYQFFHTYFNYSSNPNTRYQNSRLRLEKVVEVANGKLKGPYVFSYHAEQLPYKDSFSVDHWGYYNGAPNSNAGPAYQGSIIPAIVGYDPGTGDWMEIRGADRKARSQKAIAAMLKRIDYPTKGYAEFKYEGNTHNVRGVDEVSLDGMYSSPALNHIYASQSDPIEFELDHPAIVTINAEVKCSTMECYDSLATVPCSIPSSGYNTPYIKLIKQDNAESISLGFARTYGNFEYAQHPEKFTVSTDEVLCDLRPELCNTLDVVPLGKAKPRPDEPGKVMYCGIFDREEVLLLPGKYELQLVPLDPFELNLSVSYSNPDTVKRIHEAGGLRIAEVRLHDGVDNQNDIVKTYQYHFPTSDGSKILSAGRLMTSPVYFYTQKEDFLHWVDYTSKEPYPVFGACLNLISISNSIVPLSSAAQGSPIGYNRVIEKIGANGENGWIETVFINEPDKVIRPIIPNMPTLGKAYKNGLVTKEVTFNSDGLKVAEVLTEYDTADVGGVSKQAVALITIGSCNISFGSGPLTFFAPKIYDITHKWVHPTQKVERIFDLSDPSNQRATSVATSFYFENPAHKLLTRTVSVSSEGTEIETIYKYPLDNVASYVAPEMYSEAEEENYLHIHDRLIQTETTVNGKRETGIINSYQFDAASNKIVPKEVKQALMNGGYENRLLYDDFDNYGNPVELHRVNDVSISYVWSYGNSYPVIEVTNAGFDEIESAMGSATIEAIQANMAPTFEEIESLANAIAAAIPNCRTRFFHYKPEVGLASETDSNGVSVFYDYDSFGRLALIKDSYGNIVKKLTYGYKF